MDQLNLIPAKEYTRGTTWIELASLPDNELLIGPEPTKAFINDISIRGLLNPIVISIPETAHSTPNEAGVFDTADDPPYIVDGKRRIKAARELGLDKIYAEVITGMQPIDELGWSSALNSQRHSNPAADALNIKKLLEDNHTETQIAHVLGLPVQTIRKRMKLLGLEPELMNALLDGQMTTSTAESIAKLGVKARLPLIAKAIEGETISGADVKEVKNSQIKQMMATLPAIDTEFGSNLLGKKVDDVASTATTPENETGKTWSQVKYIGVKNIPLGDLQEDPHLSQNFNQMFNQMNPGDTTTTPIFNEREELEQWFGYEDFKVHGYRTFELRIRPLHINTGIKAHLKEPEKA